MPAYRWVSGELNDRRNWEPPLVKKPARATDMKDRERCSGYALSFFTSEEMARQRHARVIKAMNAAAAATLGTHLAAGSIDPEDGLASAPDARGHFDLHEDSRADLAPKFRVIGHLFTPASSHHSHNSAESPVPETH